MEAKQGTLCGGYKPAKMDYDDDDSSHSNSQLATDAVIAALVYEAETKKKKTLREHLHLC